MQGLRPRGVLPQVTTVDAAGTTHVITGDRGSGKSTLCARVAREALAAGLDVCGVVTEAAGLDQAQGRRVTDLRSGRSRRFGVQSTGSGAPLPSAPPGSDPLTPSWLYDTGVFRWGNEVLGHATPCDVLIIDELGPLEILGDRGWFTAFEVLARRHFGAALVVCRPSLVAALDNRLNGITGRVYHVTLDTRDVLPGMILEGLR